MSTPGSRAPTSSRHRPPPPALIAPAEPEVAIAEQPIAAWPVRLYAETRTDLGGLFFLIGIGQHLGLYADFTAPADPGIPLDPWDFTTLLGRALLRATPPDPVWPLLAGLAGRDPETPPGRGFRSPPWRTPAGWLASFAARDAWSWSAAGGRLRVDHPAGFPVLALSRTAEPPSTQLHRELAGLAPPALRRRTLPRLPSSPLSAWVAALARYVRARGALALGCPPDVVPDLLVRRPARVRITPTTLVVRFSLTDHPLPIRLAGLDRDPGWVPAAGRSVAFEFAEGLP